MISEQGFLGSSHTLPQLMTKIEFLQKLC
uniref:Uncharacterized protein n=1 Tax=Rhizophora mucronata TaxID=61149 RepID=A0A2P2PVC9_RHIMU